MRDTDNTTKKNHYSENATVAMDDAAQLQYARAIIELLDEATANINQKTAQGLLSARSKTIARRALQQTELASTVTSQGSNLLGVGGFNRLLDQHRLGVIALIISGIMLVFFAAQQFQANHNVEGSDAYLLASDLPPEAYVDQGFDTWLDSSTN